MSVSTYHPRFKSRNWRHHSSASTTTMRACTNRRLMRSLLLLISISGCSLLLAVNMASDTLCKTAAVDQLRHLHAEIRGHVPSSYDVAAGYWHMDVNYTAPPVSLLARSRYLVASKNSSCWDLAAAQREPFTAQYHPQQHPPTELPGGIPRSVWQWQGGIPRRLFDLVPFYLRESEAAGGCQHCTFVLRYKVLNGQLYTDSKRRRRALDGQEEEAALLEELLLAALHMYKVPDVDFLLHLGDGAPPGLPLVQANINRSNAQAGFTIPKYMWRDALGPQQFQVLAECLQARYPPLSQRLQRAVWRGSNTDSRHGLMDEANAMSIMRTRLHVYGMWYPDIIDAHYTAFAQQAFQTNCVEELLPPGPTLPLEAFNRYALVLDIDGNGWSDRYRLLAHANTPVLKQASNLTAFFEHLVAPGAVVQHYAHDLSDLPVRVRSLLQQQPEQLAKMAEQQQGLAHYLLNQVAVMHATAYTLLTVAQLSQWKPVMEDDYNLVPFSKCCSTAKRLPAEFVTAVRARGVAGSKLEHRSSTRSASA
ncbi:hypothetical protein COO60DRAFT_33422 [Scenedesmus sp. NREL 46B-D3]|nr:hypothetical protein COO60DRAFT_33422 [Scenedesmus sp. NREL 46B-D3]